MNKFYLYRLTSEIGGKIDFPVLFLAIAVMLPSTFDVTLMFIKDFSLSFKHNNLVAFLVATPFLIALSIVIVKMIKHFYISFVDRINNGEEMLSLAIGLFFLGYSSNDFLIFTKYQIFFALAFVSFGLIVYSLYKKASLNIVDVVITMVIALFSIEQIHISFYILGIFLMVKTYAIYIFANQKNDSDVVNTSFGLATITFTIIRKVIVR